MASSQTFFVVILFGGGGVLERGVGEGLEKGWGGLAFYVSNTPLEKQQGISRKLTFVLNPCPEVRLCNVH